jgi:hypothetical protein
VSLAVLAGQDDLNTGREFAQGAQRSKPSMGGMLRSQDMKWIPSLCCQNNFPGLGPLFRVQPCKAYANPCRKSNRQPVPDQWC